MAKIRQKSVTAKLRQTNFFLLLGFFLLLALGWLLLPYFLALGLLSIGGAGVCLWLLITPTIHYLPPTRHAVVSLDISGASKSIRFVRTNVGSFVPAIYTPKTTKETIQTSTNSKLLKTDSGGVKLTSDVVRMDSFTYNGLYHKTVLDSFEFDFAGAVCVYLCVLVRSKNDTIFDVVQLKKYLDFLQPRIFLGVLCVRVVLMVANSLYYAYLLTNRFNPSPTLPKGGNNVQTPANSAMVLEKQTNVKEVQHV